MTTLANRYAAELGQAMAHQLILRNCAGYLIVACSCTASWPGHGGRPRYQEIEARTRFPAADAIAAWRAWHERQGVAV